MEYSLNQLQAFVVTVEEGSFKAAARKLNKSAQVIARFISMMEDSCNVLLFERQVRQLHVTEEGKKLYRYAKRMMLESEKLDAQLKSFDEQLPYAFSVAIDNSLSCAAVARCYLSVLSEFPTIDLKIMSGDTKQVIEWVKSGEAEVALAFSPLTPIEGIQEMVAFNFATSEVASSSLVANEAVLTQEEQVNMTQLVPQFIYDYGHAGRYISSDKTIVCNGFDEILTMLELGVGWARVPKYKVHTLLKEGKVHEFRAEGSVPVNWYAMLYYPHESQLSVAADIFIEKAISLNESEQFK
ncbi:transcriptional regulator LysR family [Vibrio maritimus]|uniref:Transcriptional regulator LysR family n=1 Tax=Vibrio maritimus TaxID=990268 RepID=A0A090SV77_9VIBR|nr:transcriptional regulator LysR family [Vibrio maritimus]